MSTDLAAAPAEVMPRRWLALVVIALAQLMIALDATIMNVALPSAQLSLGFSDADRQWVITSYTLAFGGLLLLGGRLADHLGRKRAFLIGLVGFAAASALAGAATNLATLAVARALQGVFGAVLAPTALSLLAVTFSEQRERAKAFAIFGAIAGGGGAVGLVLGGLLTQDLGWRWCCYVNTAIAVVAALGAWSLLPALRARHATRLDISGALLATSGVVAVVFACTQATLHGWRSAFVIELLLGGAALLGLFALRESRATDPLLPLRLLRDRNRAGACLTVACAVAGMLGLFLFLTYYLQVVLGYPPITAGLAFLPMSVAVLVSAQLLASRLLPRVRPRTLIVPGLLVAAAGMLFVTRLTPVDGYAAHVLPAEILLGLGMGCVFVPAINAALQDVDKREAGVASAVVNTAQQVGGSIGVAVLNTVVTLATTRFLADHPSAPTEALVHGYTTAAAWAAGILIAAAALAAALINAGRPEHHKGGAR